jgi:hypothetical protein
VSGRNGEEERRTCAEKGDDDVDIVGACDGPREKVCKEGKVEDGKDDGGCEGLDLKHAGVVGHGG